MNRQEPPHRKAKQAVIKNPDELEFAVFCIENIAEKLGITAQRVYAALSENSNVLKSYVIPEYGALHTQGKAYIIEDILDVLNESGVAI